MNNVTTTSRGVQGAAPGRVKKEMLGIIGDAAVEPAEAISRPPFVLFLQALPGFPWVATFTADGGRRWRMFAFTGTGQARAQGSRPEFA
jgi:hypothetical protein